MASFFYPLPLLEGTISLEKAFFVGRFPILYSVQLFIHYFTETGKWTQKISQKFTLSSIEYRNIWHIINMRIGCWRFQEEESTFSNQTFDFWDIGVKKKKLNFMRKNSHSHSESYYWTLIKCCSESHSENHLKGNLESHLKVFQKVM